MMLDSGTTSHMTPISDKLHHENECDINSSFGDESAVTASTKGTRIVKCSTSEGLTTVALTENLIALDMGMSLLSVPDLVNKNIRVMFIPGKVMLFDLEDS